MANKWNTLQMKTNVNTFNWNDSNSFDTGFATSCIQRLYIFTILLAISRRTLINFTVYMYCYLLHICIMNLDFWNWITFDFALHFFHIRLSKLAHYVEAETNFIKIKSLLFIWKCRKKKTSLTNLCAAVEFCELTFETIQDIYYIVESSVWVWISW